MKGALSSWVLDGKGGGREVASDPSAAASEGLLWLHLDYQDPATVAWLRESSGIDEVVLEALLADQPRPRSLVVGEGMLVVLRAINVNDGAEPEDMVSVRMWLERDRVITLRHRPLAAVRDVVATVAEGRGPVDAGDVLHEITDRILDRIATTIQRQEDTADELEELVLTAKSHSLRGRLAELRRDSIALRRYLAPQRETIAHLSTERVPWLNDLARARLRESADRITRYIEALDSARERAAVTSEELSNRLAEQMNRNMYLLSVVAAIFLPLGLLTGLLGINVGGIPGTDSPWAFTIVTVSLFVVGGIQWVAYARIREV